MDTTTDRRIPVLEGQLSIYDLLDQTEPDNHQESEPTQ